MSMNFFNKPAKETDSKSYYAALTLRIWLAGRRHLPREVVAAFHCLVPETREKLSSGPEIDVEMALKLLRKWLKAKHHLPQDLREAIQRLVPAAGAPDEFPDNHL